jgi:hypothetical protein
MRSIFTNSLFTISAAASHSPHDGLFGWRPDRYVRVKPSSYHAEPFCVGASLHVRTSQSDVGVKRKWSDHIAAYLLAIVHGHFKSITFLLPSYISTGTMRAGSAEAEYSMGEKGPGQQIPCLHPILKLILPLDSTWRMDDILGQWYNLVEKFQRRKVTNVKDRLAAFAGFAETFSTHLKVRLLSRTLGQGHS